MVFDGKQNKKGVSKADLSKYDMAAVASYVRKHINYQANSRYDGICGILNLDKEYELHSVSGFTPGYTLHTIQNSGRSASLL
jgi:hypothetical protein